MLAEDKCTRQVENANSATQTAGTNCVQKRKDRVEIDKHAKLQMKMNSQSTKRVLALRVSNA